MNKVAIKFGYIGNISNFLFPTYEFVGKRYCYTNTDAFNAPHPTKILTPFLAEGKVVKKFKETSNVLGEPCSR